MKKSFLSLCLLLIGAGVFAFDGKIKIAYKQFGSSTDKYSFTWNLSGSKLCLQIEMKTKDVNTLTTFIPDIAKKQLISFEKLNNPEKIFFQIPLADIKSESGNIKAELTGDKKMISGFECEKLLVTSERQTTEAWVTRAIEEDWKSFAPFFQSADEIQGLAKLGVKAFPLQVTSRNEIGVIVSSSEIDAIQKETPANEVFEVPASYKLYTAAKN